MAELVCFSVLSSFSCLVILIFTAVGRVLSDTYRKGGKAVLLPGSVPGPITSVAWKHGVDIALEWYGEDVSAYREFKGRCELNKSTGALTISNLSLKDSGRYTAEINNKIMDTTEITVITAVPKPTISKQCNSEVTQCTLTCEADITDDAKPISYYWTMGDMVSPSPTNQLNITKDDAELVGKLISCQLENPVSSERSDDIISPFTNESSAGVIIAVVVVLILLVLIALGVVAGYFIWRNRRAKSENAGWRQYFAQFHPRNCLKCGRAKQWTPEQLQQRAEESVRLNPVNANGVETSPENQTVIDQEQERLVSQDNHSEAATSPENQTVTDQEQERPVSQDNHNEAEMPKNPSEIQSESGSDQTSAEPTDPSSEAEKPAVAPNAEEPLKQDPQQEDETTEE